MEDSAHPPGGRIDIVSYWTPIHPFTTHANVGTSIDTRPILESWSSFQNASTALPRCARLLAIDSTELESVFSLAGDSRPRLIRAGLFSTAIDKVAQDSAITDPAQLVRILKNIDEV